MKKDNKIFLQHILDSISDIEKYTEGFSGEDFENDIKTQDAVMRKLEIIGEAVKNLPDSLKNENPEIPWKEIAGTRDVLIHEYFGVDVDIVWNVVKKDIPVLKEQVERLMKNN